MLQLLLSHKGLVGPVYFVLDILKSIQPLSCPLISSETFLDSLWLLLVSLWVPRAVFQVLPSFLELYPDWSTLAVRLPGAPMPICACSLHATCLGIRYVVGLSLGVPCWLALALISLSQLV